MQCPNCGKKLHCTHLDMADWATYMCGGIEGCRNIYKRIGRKWYRRSSNGDGAWIKIKIEIENDWLKIKTQDLEDVAKEVYKYGKIAVNQIICMGGEAKCQPCQNREDFSLALEKLRKVLKIGDNNGKE